MNKFTLIGLSLWGILFTLSSCAKEEDEDYCLRDGYKADVHLVMNVNTALQDKYDIDLSDTTRSDVNYKLRYDLLVYRLDDKNYKNPVEQLSTFEKDVDLHLPVGSYKVLAWASYADAETGESAYFHTDDMTDILLINKEGYKGLDSWKTGFIGNSEFKVTYRTPHVELPLSPAVGQYQLMAKDEPEYKVGKVVVTYTDGLPASWNLFKGQIAHIWKGVSYTTSSNPYVFYDNIFAEDKTDIGLRIEVFDEAGTLKARRTISFPIAKGCRTKVSANLYSFIEDDSNTNTSNEEGGAGIDLKYEDVEYIILGK